MSRHMLQGLKEIADHLGLQAHSLDARRVLLSWIERESLPARRLAGRWYADASELEEIARAVDAEIGTVELATARLRTREMERGDFMKQ